MDLRDVLRALIARLFFPETDRPSREQRVDAVNDGDVVYLPVRGCHVYPDGRVTAVPDGWEPVKCSTRLH